MSNICVYDFDGTIQCDKESKEIPLEVMREKLIKLIGQQSIISQRKAKITMVQLCGMPTGNINAYEITDAGWTLLMTGFPGPQGFKRLEACDEETKEEVNLGRMFSTLTAEKPRLIRELVGHQVRIYTTGDMLTLDLRPNRCNIETSEKGGGTIISVWFG